MRASAALLLAVAAACSRAPVDPVEALLAEIAAAAEARDADRLGEKLTPGFRGTHGLGRAEAVGQLRRYFAAYESVSIAVYGVEQEREGNAARVRCVGEFSGEARKTFGFEGLLPPSAVYRFDLDVVEDGGKWRVREASWEPAEAGPEDQ